MGPLRGSAPHKNKINVENIDCLHVCVGNLKSRLLYLPNRTPDHPSKLFRHKNCKSSLRNYKGKNWMKYCLRILRRKCQKCLKRIYHQTISCIRYEISPP